MSERGGELAFTSVLHGADTDISVYINNNWKFELVIWHFSLLSLSLPKADRPLNTL